MARVNFKKLSMADYMALAGSRDINTLYFVTQLNTPTVGQTRIVIYNGNDMLFDWIALDANGKLDPSIVPSIAITDTFVVSSEAAMLAIAEAETGDIAIRTDQKRSYILATMPATLIDNWKELLTPTDAVLSVNGKTGVVTLKGSDVQVSTSDTRYISVALGALADQINSLVTGVSSVNGKTGAVSISGLDITVAGTTTGKFWGQSSYTYWSGQATSNRDSRGTTPATSGYDVEFALRTPQVAGSDPDIFVKLGTHHTNGAISDWTLITDPLSLTQVIAYLDRFALTYLGEVLEANRTLAWIKANYNPSTYPAGNVLMTHTPDGDYDYYDYYWAPPIAWNYYVLEFSETSDSRTVAEAMHDADARLDVVEGALNWN